MKEKFLEIFQREWEMYKNRTAEDDVGPSATQDGEFDSPVKAGEIRVFAEYERPLIGLLYKQVEDVGWIVIPASNFTVPATEQEILVGKRVYQLWNAFTAPKGFAEKSWLIDTMPASDMQDICSALLHVSIGDELSDDLKECMGAAIRSLADFRLDYERMFAMKSVAEPEANVEEAENVEEAPTPANWFRSRPMSFWVDLVKKSLLPEVNALPALAAATGDNQKTTLWMVDGADSTLEAFNELCVEGRFLRPFRSINGSREPYTMRFSVVLPESWKGQGEVEVLARNRSTGELAGEGTLDTVTGEGKIKTVKTEGAIDSSNQLILVVVRVAKNHG